MKKSSYKTAIFLYFGISILLSGCAQKTFETPDGTELWKMGALGVRPLAIGYKNETGRNGFIPYTFIVADKVPFEKVTRIFDEQSRDACLEVAGSEGEISVSAEWCKKSESKGDYDIYFVLDRKYLAEQLNKPENSETLEELRKHYKKDARIITAIAYAYGHEQSDRNSGKINATINTNSSGAPHLDFQYESNHKQVLSDGTVFGYEMSVLCWEKVPSNPNPIIHVVAPDFYGKDDNTCPDATNFDPDKLESDV